MNSIAKPFFGSRIAPPAAAASAKGREGARAGKAAPEGPAAQKPRGSMRGCRGRSFDTPPPVWQPFSGSRDRGLGGVSDERESAMQFTGVKVFSATKAKEREELGETVTRWLRSNADLEIVDRVVDAVLRRRVPLPLDRAVLPAARLALRERPSRPALTSRRPASGGSSLLRGRAARGGGSDRGRRVLEARGSPCRAPRRSRGASPRRRRTATMTRMTSSSPKPMESPARVSGLIPSNGPARQQVAEREDTRLASARPRPAAACRDPRCAAGRDRWTS